MSKIEELIEKLCPNGVEWKELGEVCEILDNKRKPITKKELWVNIHTMAQMESKIML